MGQIFSHPATIIVVILLIVLLFGAPKLPGMARSLGQSMRIFKTEVEGLKNDSKKDPREKDGEEVVTAEVVDNGHRPARVLRHHPINTPPDPLSRITHGTDTQRTPRGNTRPGRAQPQNQS